MVHTDHETRVVAHRIFSVVLVPSSVSPRPSSSVSDTKALDVPRTLSRAVSVFSSSAALFEKLRMEKCSSSDNLSQYNKENIAGETEPANSSSGILNRLKSTSSRVYHGSNPPQLATVDEVTADDDNRNLVSLAVMSILTTSV